MLLFQVKAFQPLTTLSLNLYALSEPKVKNSGTYYGTQANNTYLHSLILL
jgi:hypothetical protein